MSLSCINIIQANPDAVGPNLYSGGMRQARKQHACCECQALIEPGDPYFFEKGNWEGDFEEFKTCVDCLSVRNSLRPAGTYGAMWEDVEEHITESRGDIGEIHISCLRPAARDKVCDLIEEAWEQ